MRKGTMARRSIVIVILAAVALAGSGAQAASPCESDAGLCAPVVSPTALAGCNAVGLYLAQGTDKSLYGPSAATASDTSPTGFGEGAYQRLDVPGVHVGAVESHCGASSGTSAKTACGEAKLGDVRIDLRAFGAPFFVEANELEEQGCTTSLAGHSNHSATSTRSEIVITPTVPSQALPECLPTAPPTCSTPGGAQLIVYPQTNLQRNLHFDLGDYDLFVNETFAFGTGCAQNQGDVLRVTGPNLTLILGWVSTGACA